MADQLDYAVIQDFLSGLIPPREAEMQSMEAYAQKTNFPIIGPAAGYMCYQIARLIGAQSVFELGSGYGYSTYWFALAVGDGGACPPGKPGGERQRRANRLMLPNALRLLHLPVVKARPSSHDRRPSAA